MVLARKYRPKLLADLVGQDILAQTLTNAVQLNKLHHAYLFVGQFGSGKTSAARILAAMENCETSPGITPCGKCSVCEGIFAGKHEDVEEIDAASGAGKVEQIRELKTAALYSPIDGARTKYFIIDECHTMSSAGEEALLKLIEEPPPRVRFVLATTEVEKMRGTIMSRCQVHEFRKIAWRQIAEYLTKIAKAEKIKCDAGAINLCARLAGGSMRDGIQNLEKLSAYKGKEEITSEDAEKVFATVPEMLYYDIVDCVIGLNSEKLDAAAGFKVINRILQNGTGFGLVCDGLAEKLGHLMVGLSSASAGQFINASEEGSRRLMNQLKRCKSSDCLQPVLAILRYLQEARKSVEYGLSPENALQHWFLESIFAFHQK